MPTYTPLVAKGLNNVHRVHLHYFLFTVLITTIPMQAVVINYLINCNEQQCRNNTKERIKLHKVKENVFRIVTVMDSKSKLNCNKSIAEIIMYPYDLLHTVQLAFTPTSIGHYCTLQLISPFCSQKEHHCFGCSKLLVSS